MVFARFSIAAAALALFSGLCGSLAAPTNRLDGKAREVLARSVPTAPRFVIYSDKWSGSSAPPDPSAISGYNVYALSFLTSGGALDNAGSWASLSDGDRASIKSQYDAAGVKLIVSAFGATETPTSSGLDPVGAATTMANWVRQYGLDGIDVDYEDFGAMEAGTAEEWLVSFTQTLRSILPQGDYIVSHAPVAPWFSPGQYPNGAYLTIDRTVGGLIDWYNVQFYNQGGNEYTTCDSLLRGPSSAFPQSSVFEIAASGVGLDKLVIGKPATESDADNGYMDPGTLAGCLADAKNSGWNGGAMVWEYPDAGSDWIRTVRSQSWPV